jgi:threonine/homoserine/homoserine lactone efflux protein
VAGIETADAFGIALLAALFIGIPAISLAVWATAGAHLAQRLADPRTRVWFDRSMGGLLIGFSLVLLIASWR